MSERGAQLIDQRSQIRTEQVAPRLEIERFARDVHAAPVEKVTAGRLVESELVCGVRRPRLRSQAQKHPVELRGLDEADPSIDERASRLWIRQRDDALLTLAAGTIDGQPLRMVAGQIALPRDMLTVHVVVIADAPYILGSQWPSLVPQRHVEPRGEPGVTSQRRHDIEIIPAKTTGCSLRWVTIPRS